jgi:hypothetical protein
LIVILEQEESGGTKKLDETRTDLKIALIKKKIKFSSYTGKFRVEQLQSHI